MQTKEKVFLKKTVLPTKCKSGCVVLKLGSLLFLSLFVLLQLFDPALAQLSGLFFLCCGAVLAPVFDRDTASTGRNHVQQCFPTAGSAVIVHDCDYDRHRIHDEYILLDSEMLGALANNNSKPQHPRNSFAEQNCCLPTVRLFLNSASEFIHEPQLFLHKQYYLTLPVRAGPGTAV